MKQFARLLFSLVLVCLICSQVFSAPSGSGQKSVPYNSGVGKKITGKKHRLTGIVSHVVKKKGIIIVKGRRKELSFMVGVKRAKNISTGERVRVYYVTTPDKKIVVRRIKKLNNGKEATEDARGKRGNSKGEL